MANTQQWFRTGREMYGRDVGRFGAHTTGALCGRMMTLSGGYFGKRCPDEVVRVVEQFSETDVSVARVEHAYEVVRLHTSWLREMD
jgi:hypothetical protein